MAMTLTKRRVIKRPRVCSERKEWAKSALGKSVDKREHQVESGLDSDYLDRDRPQGLCYRSPRPLPPLYDADAAVIGVEMHDAVIVCVYGADPARSQFALTL